jgi:hypothetical protein
MTGLTSRDKLQQNNHGRLHYTTLTKNRSSRQNNNNKETSELTDTIDQMDLTDVYRVFPQ